MRIGIFGASADPQTQAVVRELGQLGVAHVIIDKDALERGQPLSFEDGSVQYLGQSLDDVRGYFVRFVPQAYTPEVEQGGELLLRPDWRELYLRSRERASTYVSWLVQLQHSGAALVNPPQAASMLQYKPFQLHALRTVGAAVPRTLISNDPEQVRAFHAELKDVILKPLMGGALTQQLDEQVLEQLELIRRSPTIFQERVRGADVRVVLIGDRIVSSVAIVTPEQHLDFRADPVYSSGGATYQEVELPEPIQAQCRQAARLCGLSYTGIDIKHEGDRYVFLELNSSPIYYDVEVKLGHQITAALARHLVQSTQAALEHRPR